MKHFCILVSVAALKRKKNSVACTIKHGSLVNTTGLCSVGKLVAARNAMNRDDVMTHCGIFFLGNVFLSERSAMLFPAEQCPGSGRHHLPHLNQGAMFCRHRMEETECDWEVLPELVQ